jgi:rhodanese-related sulfurtransferase
MRYVSRSEPGSVTVDELKAKLDGGEKPFILDVREPNEWQICRIPGARLIPMAEVPSRIGELDRHQEIVVHCKMGGRSARVVNFLRQQGFENAHNLEGGILAWIDRVDPTQRKY